MGGVALGRTSASAECGHGPRGRSILLARGMPQLTSQGAKHAERRSCVQGFHEPSPSEQIACSWRGRAGERSATAPARYGPGASATTASALKFTYVRGEVEAIVVHGAGSPSSGTRPADAVRSEQPSCCLLNYNTTSR